MTANFINKFTSSFLIFCFCITLFSCAKVTGSHGVYTGNINSVLMAAVRKGATVQTLLDKGIDVNAKDENGETALMKAAWWNHPDIVQALLDVGADVNAKKNNGWTALMFAVNKSHTTIIQILLNNGADIKAENNNGKTAMMIAAENNHTAIVQAELWPNLVYGENQAHLAATLS